MSTSSIREKELSGFPPSGEKYSLEDKEAIKKKIKDISSLLSEEGSLVKLKEGERDLKDLKEKLIELERKSIAQKTVLRRIWKGAKRVFGGPGKTSRSLDGLLNTLRKKIFATAIRDNNAEEVTQRLNADKKLISEVVESTYTPVCLAAITNRPNILKILLDKCGSLREGKIYGKGGKVGLLNKAVKKGADAAVNSLLDKEREMGVVDKPFKLAVSLGKKSTVEVFLTWAENNESFLSVDFFNIDPKEMDKYETTKFLLESDRLDKNSIYKAFKQAFQAKNVEIVTLALAKKSGGWWDIDASFFLDAFNNAQKPNASEKDKAILEAFLKSGVEKRRLNEALEKAIKSNDFVMADRLINAGADSDNRVCIMILVWAIQNEKIDIVKRLLKDSPVSTHDLVYPYHVAIWEGNKEIVDLLLNKGVPKSVQDWQGVTPLEFAIIAKQNREDMVGYLLEKKFSKSELRLALLKVLDTSFSNIKILRSLKEHGASLDSEDVHKYLKFILESHDVSVNKFLLDWGREKNIPIFQNVISRGEVSLVKNFINSVGGPDEKDSDGDTLLHKVVKDNKLTNDKKLAIVEFLISDHANKYIKNNNGKTPLDLCPNGFGSRKMKALLS